MTIPGYGRLAPLQLAMLRLAGYRVSLSWQDNSRPLTDTERLAEMAAGLRELRNAVPALATCGVSLAAWHRRLQKEHGASYRHTYGWATTRDKVEAAYADPHYQSLAAELAARFGVATSEEMTMNDADLVDHPLYADIAADPAADEPRLVLADALMQAGEPRGELITLQCELAQILGEQPALSGAWTRSRLHPLIPEKTETRARQITRRQNQLLKEHLEWTPVLEGDGEIALWRGFLASLTLRGLDSWSVERLEALLHQAPLISQLNLLASWGVGCNAGMEGQLLELCSRYIGSSLESLLIQGADDAAIAEVLAKVRFPALRWISFGAQRVPSAIIAALLENPSLSRLEALYAEAGLESAEDVARLLEAPNFTITDLVTPRTSLRRGAAEVLAGCPKLSALRILDVTRTGLGAAGLEALLTSKHAPQGLERLAAAWLQLKGDELSVLADATSLSKLEVLDLESNRFGPAGMDVLGASTKLTALRSLTLRNCRILDEGLEALLASPLFPRLQELNLRSNGLTVEGMLSLSRVSEENALLKLNVNNNKLGVADMTPVWEAPQLAACRIFVEAKKPKGKAKGKE